MNSRAHDPAAELIKWGGAKVILATVTSGKAMSVVLGGLSLNGKLIVVGAADEPLEVNGGLMLMGRRSILGWPSSSSIDSQDTLSFTYSPLVDVVSNNLAHTGRALVARGQCIEQYGAGEAYLPILDVVEDL